MAKGKGQGVPPTFAEPREQEMEAPIPIQITLNIVGLDLNKVTLPNGAVITTLNLISPTGIAVAVRMNEGTVNDLVKELSGVKIDTFSAAALPK